MKILAAVPKSALALRGNLSKLPAS